MAQQITWTALPAGIAPDGRLRLRALATLRLAGSAPEVRVVDEFPDVLSWPIDAAAAEWVVQSDVGELRVVEVDRSGLDADGWTDLLAEAVVRPFVAQHKHADDWASWPAVDALADVKGLYAELAQSDPEERPRLGRGSEGPLATFVGQVGRVLTGAPPFGRRPLSREESRRLRMSQDWFDGLPPLAQRFAAADRFYDPPRELGDHGPTAPPIAPPRPDVHGLLAALGDHPHLLRRFGFLVDLLVEAPGEVPPTRVWLEPRWPSVFDVVRPRSACDTSFLPAPGPAGGHLAGGFLALAGADDGFGPGAWHLATVDPDGAVLQLTAAAATLRDAVLREGQHERDVEATVPALRSGGLAVLWRGRLDQLLPRLAGAAAFEGQPEDQVVLFAEHLTRGFRVDVRREGAAAFRSLCRREMAYDIAGRADRASDEGYVKATSAARREGKQLLHESVVRWEGWSLVAPRPFRIPRYTDDPAEPEHLQEPEPEAGGDFPLRSTPTAEAGTLPPLRFGRRYQVRARAVDLAGGSLDHADPGDAQATAAVPYTRFEPVGAPEVLATGWFREGESLERLAVRSSAAHRTPEEHATAEPRYRPTARRHVSPPKASQQLAEQHGALDGRTPADAYLLSAREDEQIVAADAPLRTRAEIDAGGIGAARALPEDASLPTDWDATRPPPGSHPLHDGALLGEVPYLPDPLALGAALRLRDRHPEAGWSATAPYERIGWYPDLTAWPDGRPFVLEVRGPEPGEPAVAWDEAGRVLVVRLEPSEIRSVLLSSALVDEARDQLGLLRWAPGLDPAMVLDGRCWMTTPDRELVLVHAVQEPLALPVLRPPPDLLAPYNDRREVGATWFDFAREVELHLPSTGQVDVEASWQEPVDEPEQPLPDLARDGGGHIAAIELPDVLTGDAVWLPLDFRPVRRTRGPFLRHEFGDTKRRKVRYRVRATSSFREYFDRALWDPDPSPLQVVGPEQEIDVPASARPAPPAPVYAVPSFRWERSDDGDRIVSVRHGGTLRVYVERPWWSSGTGEQLALVFASDAQGSVPDPLAKRLTVVARDPLWETPAPRLARPQHVGGAEVVEAADAVEGGLVDLALLGEPTLDQFHAERGLWFWDIDLSRVADGSYGAFARLGLARFQPHALYREDLSPIVALDPVGLPPSRWLTVDREGDAVLVILSGVAPGRGGVSVTAEWQVHDGTTPGDLGWAPLGTTEVVQLAELPEELVRPEVLRWHHRPAVLLPLLRLRHLIWSADLAVPRVSPGAGRRLVIREHEHLLTDPEAAGKREGRPDPHREIQVVPATRVVYVEAVEV